MDLPLLARQMFVDVLAPALLAFAILMIPRRIPEQTGKRSKKDESPTLDWRGPLALAIAYVTSHVLAEGWTGFPPRNALNWLTWMVVFAGVVGLVEGLWHRPRWATIPFRVAIVGATLWYLLQSPIQWTWTETSQDVKWLAALGGGTLLIWFLTNVGLERPSSRTFVVTMGVILALTAISLALTGSVRLGQRAGAAAAAVGGIWLASVLPGGSQRVVGRGTVCVFTILLVGLVLNGHYTSELPASAALLLATSPLAILLTYIIPIGRDRRPWLAASVPVIGATILAGTATGFAVADHLAVQAADSESGEYDPYENFSPDG